MAKLLVMVRWRGDFRFLLNPQRLPLRLACHFSLPLSFSFSLFPLLPLAHLHFRLLPLKLSVVLFKYGIGPCRL